MALLPLYRDQDYILCDMPLARCYAIVHALSVQNGVECVWADEIQSGQTHDVERARELIRRSANHE